MSSVTETSTALYEAPDGSTLSHKPVPARLAPVRPVRSIAGRAITPLTYFTLVLSRHSFYHRMNNRLDNMQVQAAQPLPYSLLLPRIPLTAAEPAEAEDDEVWAEGQAAWGGSKKTPAVRRRPRCHCRRRTT